MPHTKWQPDRVTRPAPWPLPSFGAALARGFVGRCPVCDRGPAFAGFLRVVPECSSCQTPLGLARADDAPPYFTILIVGHIVVPLMLLMERAMDPPLWLLSVIFLPLTAALAVGLLRPIKGATVGAMLKLNMLKSDDERA